MRENKLITPTPNNKFSQELLALELKEYLMLKRKDIFLSDLKKFEACFCTNAVQLVCPVGSIDQINFENSVSYSNQIRNELMIKYKERQTL